MAFHRTMQLGVLGAVLALAAVPTTANAGATMYSDYATWTSSGAGSLHEVTTLCQVPYGASCPASPGPYADSPDVNTGVPTPNTPVPLAWLRTQTPSTPQVNLNHPTGTTMFRNIVGADNSPTSGNAWSSFWPNDPKFSTAYTGDVWVTKTATAGGNPITSIALTLSSPLTSFGFIAMPEDDTQLYNVTVTLLDGVVTDTSLTEQVGGCAQSGNGSNCGFFGYTGGNLVTGITVSIAGVLPPCPTGGVLSSECENLQGGIAVGDFFAGPAVPEPASLAILGVGLVGLGAIRRRLRA